MFTLKVVHADNNIDMHRIGWDCRIEWLDGDMKATVYDPAYPGNSIDVPRDAKGYVMTQGKTEATI